MAFRISRVTAVVIDDPDLAAAIEFHAGAAIFSLAVEEPSAAVAMIRIAWLACSVRWRFKTILFSLGMGRSLHILWKSF
jgi:hypothetical protein